MSATQYTDATHARRAYQRRQRKLRLPAREYESRMRGWDNAERILRRGR